MANFKLPGFRQWLKNVSEETAAAGAKEIVTDLKKEGPYWTGEFEEAWVVLPGDKRVPADKQSALTKREKLDGWESGEFPLGRRITDTPIPQGVTTLTIGNRMKYRNIAMDLEPGRTPKTGNTAEPDWFVKYAQGQGLKSALERATLEAANTPRVKGFRGPKKGK